MLSLASPRLRAGLLALLVVLAWPSHARAQCFGPDNLDIGNCCGPAVPNLPVFPAASVPSLGVCWNACSVAGTQDLRLDMSPPAQVACAQYISQFTVSDTSSVPLLSGLLQMDYARTWEEIDPSGALIQVWRFVVKVDLNGVAGVPPSACVTPSCVSPVGPHTTAFYYGYLDFASCNAVPGAAWETSLVLFHNCDRFIHAPGLSDKPGVFHPGGSYALVAPHTSAQPFIPGNAFAPSGPVFAEAMRTIDTSTPPPNVCLVEDRVVAGSMNLLGAGCVCTFSTTPKQQSLRRFDGQTACPTATGIPAGWASVDPGFPIFPWLHMVTTSIGSWTNPSIYPGAERAWVDEGVFAVADACTGDWAEIRYGATTRGGWTVNHPVLIGSFTDMADNYTAPLFGPYPAPLIGSVQPTDRLIYINTP